MLSVEHPIGFGVLERTAACAGFPVLVFVDDINITTRIGNLVQEVVTASSIGGSVYNNLGDISRRVASNRYFRAFIGERAGVMRRLAWVGLDGSYTGDLSSVGFPGVGVLPCVLDGDGIGGSGRTRHVYGCWSGWASKPPRFYQDASGTISLKHKRAKT